MCNRMLRACIKYRKPVMLDSHRTRKKQGFAREFILDAAGYYTNAKQATGTIKIIWHDGKDNNSPQNCKSILLYDGSDNYGYFSMNGKAIMEQLRELMRTMVRSSTSTGRWTYKYSSVLICSSLVVLRVFQAQSLTYCCNWC
eukprot:scaffold255446_cov17-Prasinocladus_malaysianus.AAC.2